MRRRRLLAMVVGASVMVPAVPAAAIEPQNLVAAEDTATDATSDSEETTDVSVPLPGLGEAEVSVATDPDAQTLEAELSGDVAQSDLGVSTSPKVDVSASSDTGVDVDASAPTVAGPLELDPVETVGPVLDLVDDTAPGVVPDVRPEAPATDGPVDRTDTVRPAASPAGTKALGPGGETADAESQRAPVTSVIRRPAGERTPGSGAPTSPFDGLPAPEVAAGDGLHAAGPLAPPHVDSTALVRALAALLVLAAGIVNRIVARETT